jgi:integrase/recombinase XerD
MSEPQRDRRDVDALGLKEHRVLGAGIDTSTIALWLGHEQERTTHVYLHADLALKQRTLDRITPPSGHPGRYRAPDSIIAFLDAL